MRYLIVTGQSGAGKTACVRYLEDKGSFCMDNMPPMMLPKLIEAFDTTPGKHQTVTIAVDVRSGEFFDANAVAKMIKELRVMGHQIEVIFMEASDETLLYGVEVKFYSNEVVVNEKFETSVPGACGPPPPLPALAIRRRML